MILKFKISEEEENFLKVLEELCGSEDVEFKLNPTNNDCFVLSESKDTTVAFTQREVIISKGDNLLRKSFTERALNRYLNLIHKRMNDDREALKNKLLSKENKIIENLNKIEKFTF